MGHLKASIFLTLLLLLILDPAGARLHAATLLVPGNYKTIQEAVDAAEPGDFILVEEGEYSENVALRKPLTLRAVKGPEKTVIRARDKKTASLSLTGVDGAAVAGFTLTGSDKAGLALRKTVNSRIAGNSADKNYNGITLDASEHNILSGNTANNNVSYGIYLLRSNSNRIEKNSANSNLDQGIFLSYSNLNVVTGNRANLNTWNGITMWDSHSNELRDNVTLRNAFGVVTVDSDDNLMEGNTSLPNIFLILPIVLIYIGILSYMAQKNILKYIYKV